MEEDDEMQRVPYCPSGMYVVQVQKHETLILSFYNFQDRLTFSLLSDFVHLW
jgi:hypothetical protein